MPRHEYAKAVIVYITVDERQVQALETLGLRGDTELARCGDPGKLVNPEIWVGVERPQAFDRHGNEHVPDNYEKSWLAKDQRRTAFFRPVRLPRALYDEFGLVLKKTALLSKPAQGRFAGKNVLVCVFREGRELEAESRAILNFFKACLVAGYDRAWVRFRNNIWICPLEFWFEERLTRPTGKEFYFNFDFFGEALFAATTRR